MSQKMGHSEHRKEINGSFKKFSLLCSVYICENASKRSVGLLKYVSHYHVPNLMLPLRFKCAVLHSVESFVFYDGTFYCNGSIFLQALKITRGHVLILISRFRQFITEMKVSVISSYNHMSWSRIGVRENINSLGQQC